MRSGRGSSSSVHLADVGRRRGQKWALTLGTECGARGSCSGAAAGLRASGTRGLPHVVPFFNVQDSGMGGQPADGEGKVGSVEVPAPKQDARSHEDAQAVQHAAVMVVPSCPARSPLSAALLRPWPGAAGGEGPCAGQNGLHVPQISAFCRQHGPEQGNAATSQH